LGSIRHEEQAKKTTIELQQEYDSISSGILPLQSDAIVHFLIDLYPAAESSNIRFILHHFLPGIDTDKLFQIIIKNRDFKICE
jgi:hypothetical protein